MSEDSNGIPVLPCPNCAANLLLNGFYNFCSERSTVTERNYAHVVHGRIYMDHDETDNQVEEHKCELTAYCRACNTELPWALYELRDIDGARPQVAQEMVTALLSKIKREPGAGTEAQPA